jgi:hypothetical protein
MSTLTHLSDQELDAVTGGHGFSISLNDVNIALVSQSQANVNYSAFSWVSQSNTASVSVSQTAG